MNRFPPPPCTIVICGKADIINVLSKQRFDAVISIINPGRNKMWFPHRIAKQRKKMEKHCSNILQMQFWDTENDFDVGGPRDHHIIAIREFSRNLLGKKIIIHCMQGISRSPAAAIIVLRSLGYPHDDATNHVLQVQPSAMPNQLMLKIDDAQTKPL